MKPKIKAQPLQIDLNAVIAALKSENRQLHAKLGKITGQNFSLKSEVAALKKELKNVKKHSDSPDAAKILDEHLYGKAFKQIEGKS